MGCCGDREKALTVAEEQKWTHLTLSDFKSTSCLAPFSYVWLWILVLVSCAVYAADAFTAINLLAFDKWTSTIKPAVPFEIAKWIFAITIIISYVFLLYRWIRTMRVMRTGSVTECYLEPLAAIWQSMRITSSGQGWRRFLVFAELTKSKKGVNYIALFVYFQFKSALLIIVAQGPRVAINAMTLYAVMQAQIIPGGDHAAKDRSNFEQFFVNIKTMIDTGNRRETVIYFAMLFSLLIWVIAALSLIVACLLYIFFLWHYIPKADGSLTNYCRRKVETRLERIVGKKIKKAIEKQNQQLKKQEERAIKKGQLDVSKSRPTLPNIGDDDDDTSTVFSLQRSDTMSTNTTLPPYAPYPQSHTNSMVSNNGRNLMMKPSLPTLDERPSTLARSESQFTTFSTNSYGSNAPMLPQAGNMGRASPAPGMAPLDRNGSDYSGQQRNLPYPSDRPFTQMSQGRASPMPQRGHLPPVDTSFNNAPYGSEPRLVSPLANDARTSQAQSSRPYQGFSPYNSRGPATGPEYELSPVESNATEEISRHYYPNPNDYNDYQPPQVPNVLRAGSPAPSQFDGLPNQPRSNTAPPHRDILDRTMNGSVPPQRSATAPIQQPGWAQGPPPRSFTPSGPGPQLPYTPSGPGPQRPYTPSGPGPQRSFTPSGPRPNGHNNY
ncbi:hypothetical protein COCC4DRAFT_60706 [Bipolaris maydis ATCC 48331]|uniref:Vacuolar membrane protein n=2 Tax=Cochliobolus heterostrophus TaxID=5016 RepID=M2STE1_COCH5|nr:uncharacterized protein COCC4DRAFT_60706 [Bipolaris maydis ATCC 48331]EMD88630.1 hypothetical protein COCHEDRAFT_1196583 [Bipolaris maydis C5]KAH7556703.1 hypothetical protein BM1_06137 [Bipolaris maydis]ENI05654.1 hypothetical protein COCC4DRAFT_60706 [Bipolaris maydis ATCC 48331]KAJ5028772.1 hypothetical protein J3E73DRAFT_380013 [Bipolaris maydis]KAJ5063561.1 hypothetical protein J3E74DRAFT_264728 [Bipolaris maydis]